MRVLMICPELPTADSPGSMAPAMRQIQSISNLGIDVDIVDMRGIPKFKYLQVIPKIRRFAKQADLIHAHFGYCGWLARVAPKKPFVMSFMGDDLLGTPKSNGQLETFSRWMVKANCRLAKRADAVIVKSDEMAGVIATVESSVIPNGVDTEVFRPLDRRKCRSQLGLGDGIKILFPGDPDNPRKGFSLANDAVRKASSLSGKEIDLIPLWNVKPEDVPVYMNACNAMLMTSLIEGSPNVVKEAMACDIPVVGVPVGDVQQMLSGVNNSAFCQRDANEIAEQMLRVIALEQSNGRDTIFARGLDLESVAKKIKSIYESVLASESTQQSQLDRPHELLPSEKKTISQFETVEH